MGFCLFGVVGWCDDKKQTETTIKMQTEVCQKFLEETFNNVTNEMKKTSSNINRIIATGRGDIIIENITMDQVAELKAEGKLNLELAVKSDIVINNLIDRAAEVAREINNKNTGGNRSTFTKTEQEAITYVKTELTKRTTNTTFSSCVASILNTNEIRAEAEGNIIIRAIIMKQVSSLAAKCVMSSFISQVGRIQNNNDIKDRLREETKIRDHGLFDGQTTALIVGAAAVFLVVMVLAMKSKKNE